MGGGVPRLGGRKHGKMGKGKKEKRGHHASYDATGRINLRGILVCAYVCWRPNNIQHSFLQSLLFPPLPFSSTHKVGNPYTDPVENLVGMIDALWGRDLIPEDVYGKWAKTCVSKDPDAYYSKVRGLVG